ncbi:lipopolysaccharide biosynthesis protein [Arenibaculum pallidiluteum]|uniref:lipopolysaccharide biosynthesis protein n=1 Tax=Arenibaculum pallidiluteum TaxID=2812559 RepID=UPI001A97C2F4|nr:oligosaccharide flippase family protein [Arenibaculum pallidiluteum]
MPDDEGTVLTASRSILALAGIRDRPFLRQVSVLVGGTAFAHALALAATPVLTRLYGPEEIGLLSLYVAFVALWSSFLSLRYESAVCIARAGWDVGALLILGGVLVLAMSLLGTAVLFLLGRHGVLGFDALPAWAAALCLPASLAWGAALLARAWQVRIRRFWLITHSVVTRSLLGILLSLAFGVLSFGAAGLLAAETLSVIVGMLILVLPLRPRIRTWVRRIPRRRILAVGGIYRRFPLHELPSTVLDKVAFALPVLLVTSLFDVAAAGLFGLAFRIVGAPAAQIGPALGDVFVSRYAELHRKGRYREGERLFRKTLSRLALAGLAPLVLFVALAPAAFPLVLGPAWGEAGAMAAWLSLWMYGLTVVSPLSRLLAVTQRQALKFTYDFSAIAASLGAFWLAQAYRLPPDAMVAVLSLLHFLAYGIYLAILLHVVRRAAKAEPVTSRRKD